MYVLFSVGDEEGGFFFSYFPVRLGSSRIHIHTFGSISLPEKTFLLVYGSNPLPATPPLQGYTTSEAPPENLSSLLFYLCKNSLIFVFWEKEKEEEKGFFHVEKPLSCLHLLGRQGGHRGLPRRCCRGAKAISFPSSLSLSLAAGEAFLTLNGCWM